jgi:hypothetical protein
VIGKGTYGQDWPAYNAAQTNEKPQLLTVTAGRAFILRNRFRNPCSATHRLLSYWEGVLPKGGGLVVDTLESVIALQ